MTATVDLLSIPERCSWNHSVRFKLAFDDLRFRLAEERAEPTKFGMAHRFRDLAATGLLEEGRFRTCTLARPILYSDARAGLADAPIYSFKVLLPTQLHEDFKRWVTAPHKGYAHRFLRLVEVGLLFEQGRDQHSPLAARSPAPKASLQRTLQAQPHPAPLPIAADSVDERVLRLARCVEELEW